MSTYDRSSLQQNNDRPNIVPIEPVDWFEGTAAEFPASEHTGRVMFQAGVGLVRSDGTNWNPVPQSRTEFVPAFNGKAGATIGWVVTGADDGLARLPASKTASTLIIPIKGLAVGERVDAVRVLGQVESAGSIATLSIDVRKATAAAADFADVSLGTAATGNLTADTLISGSVLEEVLVAAEVLGADEYVYVVLTGTTALATDIAVAGVQVDIVRP